MATAIRCTLPGCSCECFNPCKSQLRTCQSCQHGWVAHDSLTVDQVSKIRKKGLKHGRPCQHPRCDCDDYKNTSTGIQASWLAKCNTCKHSDNDHRIPTSFDKLRAQHVKHAGTSSCVGCALECQGFGKQDDSVSLDSPLSKQCTLCGHFIENHRPKMETDDVILTVARDNTSISCQKMLEVKDQMTKGGKYCDGYDIHDWFEAVNVDPDERQDTSDANNCHCLCRGFVVDDLARLCHIYYGLPKEIVLPHLSSINCQRCSHNLSDHRKLNDEEQKQMGIRDRGTLCGHFIENHRPKMETDDVILTVARDNTSISCQKMLEVKDQMTKGGKYCDGYDIHDWFEAVNVDPDERQDTSDTNNCHCLCRGFVVDDLARLCHIYYGLPKEIVLPHLSSINCQRCSHNLSDHRKLNDEEQKQRDIQNEPKLTVLSMSQVKVSAKDGQNPVALYTPDCIGPQMFGLAQVKGSGNKNASLKIGVIPVKVPHSKIQMVKETNRKRKNSGRILSSVKNKLKKRKLMSNSAAGDSDELRSDESSTCSESDSISLEGKNGARKHLSKRSSGEIAMDDKPVWNPEELALTVTSNLMDHMQEMSIELPKTDVKALAWGRIEGNTNLLLAVGFEDSSLMIYKVTVGMVTEIEKCNYDGLSPVSRLLWISQGTVLLLAVGSTDGRVNLIKVTEDGTTQIGILENSTSSRVTAISAPPSGSSVCVGQQDGSVSFYMINSDSGMIKLLSTSSISYGAVQSLAWHPSKNIVVAAGEDDHITVFYMETLADRKKDKTRGTIMHYLGKKRRFELDIFNKCCKLKGHMSFVAAVTFDPSGSFLVSAGWDGQILFWNTTDIDDVISCGAGDVSTVECSTGFMIGQRKFRNFPKDGINFMPLVLSLAQPIIYMLAHIDSETLCLVSYHIPKKYR
ncbi:uncharacterized protein LOC117114052 [Anneissia japonica]|uniref:uncharacterized protein LOC117114052 n=1 Tax=Anneissia japonica TaxID=1529436 RepID=UPI0014258C46|nr:uncharacterized protein LOC117114052 [Anneissia japonica]